MPAPPRPFDLARIGTGLPVAERIGALAQAAQSGAMVVTAPPGTGKTTLVPPLVANLVEGTTLVVQPRRVAVRAAARRLAQLDGSEVGERVGFTVRGERRMRDGARIEVLTPGVLLRRLLADPELGGVGAVILDEVHERSLETDLLLGMVAEVRELREDLQVTAMSATLDADAVAAVLGGAPIVDVPAVLHPLTIEHAPPSVARLDHRGVTWAFLDHLAAVTVRAHDQAGDVDALVFVPGAREVDETVRRIRALTSADVLPLHGRLSPRDQDRATSGRASGEGRRIVVSTALAESSLTVPGVRLVVDACFSREVRRDRGRGMTGLVTVTESRASADQRAGRAARQGPGTAVRVIDANEDARMRASAPPEIASADLTDAALLLACWGTPRGDGLALLDAPPAASIAEAESALHALGVVDEAGHATPRGREVAGLPVGVREATALLAVPGAAPVVAALSDDHRAEVADLAALLRALGNGRAPGADRWRRETARLERLTDASGTADPGIVVATARPDRIARRTGAHARTYLLASGTRAALPEGSPLIAHEWLAVWEVQRAEGRAADGTGAVIRLTAPLSEADALRIGAPMLTSERRASVDGTRVTAREERRLGAITLASTPTAVQPGDQALAIMAHVRETGIGALTWSDTAEALRRRLALIHRELGDPWPAMDDDSLLDRADEWLAPALAQLRPGQGLDRIDLASALRSLLPWPEASRLDELAPERLAVPSGSHIRIDYPEAGIEHAADPPVIAVKLQECFGLADTPRLVDGRVGVLFHLLSPARRPLAVTADLASFWSGPYQDVRKEMRGRYPKHPWPEDPWTAPATARTTRRA